MSDLYNRMKEIEGTYLQPQSFKQYKNYWLPESIVKESKNVLSYGCLLYTSPSPRDS